MSSRSELRRIAIQNPDKLLEIALKQEDRIAHLEAVVQDYEQALEFYAEEGNHKRTVEDTLGYLDSEDWLYEPSEVSQDEGQKAREVLEKYSDKSPRVGSKEPKEKE